MNQHPHIEIITAWYNGATIQIKTTLPERPWVDVENYKTCDEDDTPKFLPSHTYRIKPKTYTLVLSEEEMETLEDAVADSIDRNGVDDSIDALKAKIREAEKNA